MVQSYSKPHTPTDNAVAEAFFKSLKQEELYRRVYRSEREFKESIAEYMRFYNEDRPHKTLHYKTPIQFEAEYYDGGKPVNDECWCTGFESQLFDIFDQKFAQISRPVQKQESSNLLKIL